MGRWRREALRQQPSRCISRFDPLTTGALGLRLTRSLLFSLLATSALAPSAMAQTATGQNPAPAPAEGESRVLDFKADKLDYDSEAERSEEQTSELQSLMRISYAALSLTKENKSTPQNSRHHSSTIVH